MIRSRVISALSLAMFMARKYTDRLVGSQVLQDRWARQSDPQSDPSEHGRVPPGGPVTLVHPVPSPHRGGGLAGVNPRWNRILRVSKPHIIELEECRAAPVIWHFELEIDKHNRSGKRSQVNGGPTTASVQVDRICGQHIDMPAEEQALSVRAIDPHVEVPITAAGAEFLQVPGYSIVKLEKRVFGHNEYILTDRNRCG